VERTANGLLAATHRAAQTIDVVGCGAVTETYHAPHLRRLEKQGRIRIRHCVDVRQDAANRLAGMFKHARAEGLRVAKERVFGADTALVATPPESHADWILAYATAGASVLVEKPAVISNCEFRRVSKVVSESGGRVLVGHFRRFYPSALAARSAVANGLIGDISRISVLEGARWEWASRSRYPVESHWGGVVLDTGSHALDMALYVSGLDESRDVAFSIERARKTPPNEPSHEVKATLVLHLPAGRVPLSLALSRRGALPNVVRVCGTKGELLIPTSYSSSAYLRADNQVLVLAGVSHHVARDVESAFAAQYEVLLRPIGSGGATALIDFSRFGLLTRILEGLTKATE